MREGPSSEIGLVSTYPPTGCGIASYAASLLGGLSASGAPSCAVVSLVDAPHPAPPPEVVHQHRRGDRRSLRAAAAWLDRCAVVSVQHEFGIYGGPDGVEVLDLLAATRTPAVVTMHTVLAHPSVRQRQLVRRLAERAERVVVMGRTPATRLTEVYGVADDRVVVIPHGVDTRLGAPAVVPTGRPTVLTWGLIGPGKGIEVAIEAMAGLADLRPRPRYLVQGMTHPVVREREGEAYRDRLRAQVRRRGLEGVVDLDDRYVETYELAAMVGSAAAVVLPYDAVEQVTSGVLVEAVAAGRPVVATAFPHAEELLADGAGLVVPHRDPEALAAALRSVLTDPALARELSGQARRRARGWRWPSVARRHLDVFAAVRDHQERPAAAAAGLVAG